MRRSGKFVSEMSEKRAESAKDRSEVDSVGRLTESGKGGQIAMKGLYGRRTNFISS